MIGLLDYDLFQSESTTHIIPNLEIMKLATYYYIEENHFCRLLSLDDGELDSYDKIYFFSELGHKLLIPPQFKLANNVIYGGSAFTGFKYLPFENKIIDYTIPRVTIYKDFLKQKYHEGFKNLVISHTLDDTYYRMYAGNNRLPIPAIKSKQRVYLFDRSFFYPDWQDIIKDIADRKPTGIYRIHPIVCNTLTDFFQARNCNKLARSIEYILDLKIPLNEVDYMIKHYKKLFLADVAKTSRVYLPLKSNLATKESYYRNLIYTFNLLYAFWACNIPIRIYREETPIGVTNNPIIELEEAMATWSNSSVQKSREANKTLLQRIGKNKKLLCQYEDLINEKPYVNVLFNQSYENLSKKGVWRI